MTRQLASETPCVVGQMYLVPCMHVEQGAATLWMPPDRWVPLLGPKHSDAEHLDFNWEHFHVDWRFIPSEAFDSACFRHQVPHANVLTNSVRGGGLVGMPVLKLRKCRREMPDFPQVNGVATATNAIKWEHMERAQAFTCNKLKPGNICPHRGIDLTPFIKPDGTVVCPGHGLKFDTLTGWLMPRHGEPA